MSYGVVNDEAQRYSPLLQYSSGGSEGHDDLEGRGRQRYGPQVMAALVTYLAAVSGGMTVGYTSPAIPDLEHEHVLVGSQSSWFGSIVTIGAIGGGPLAGLAVNKLGRKLTIMTCALPYTLGWLAIVSTTDYTMLLIGRILTGLGLGMTSLCVPIYLAETASKNIRGIIGSCYQLSTTVGVLLGFVFGIVLSWRWLAIALALPATIMIVLMAFMPESPRWLLSQGRYIEAATSLRWLRGPSYDIDAELDDIQQKLMQTDNSLTLGELFSPKVLRPFMVSLGLMMFQQLGGIGAVIFYTSSIFETAGFSGNSTIPTVTIGAVQVIATVISSVLMDKAGRRILLLISAILVTLSSFSFGLFYFLQETKHMNNLGWLSLSSLIVFVITFSLGWGPIPWLMMGELFPVKVQGITCTISIMAVWLCGFLVTKEFADMESLLHNYGAFWLFAAINFLGIIFVAVFVPETKGKTLEDIENYFEGSQNSKENRSPPKYGAVVA